MSVPANRSLVYALPLTLLMALCLNGCTGGISGTGDGSIIVETDNDSTSGMDNIPEGTSDSVANMQNFPATLTSAELTTSLTNTATPLDPLLSSTSNSVTSELNGHIQSYATVAGLVSQDLALLESQLTTELGQCAASGRCDTIPTTVAVNSNNDGSDRFFSSVEYSRGLAGYFDSQLTYNRSNGDSVDVRWSTGKEYVFLYTDTAVHSTYSLLQNLQQAVTFRHYDKTGNTLIQASLAGNRDDEASTATTIEADLVDWYVKALVNEQSSVLYAANAVSGDLRREAITSESNEILAETCELPDCIWQPEHSTATSAFENTESTVGNFADSYISNPANFSFVQPTTRFVAATSANGQSPEPQSIICGGTTVQNLQRVFCWTPLPIEINSSFFFDENISPGGISYQPIQIQ